MGAVAYDRAYVPVLLRALLHHPSAFCDQYARVRASWGVTLMGCLHSGRMGPRA
jgi:hypothetical protein